MNSPQIIDFEKQIANNFLARICTNVYDSEGNIQDKTRLAAHFELIEDFMKSSLTEANLIMIGHAGRPKGTPTLELSLKTVANYFSNELGYEIKFIPSLENLTETLANITEGKNIYLLENIRFNPGEESKDDPKLLRFAQSLAEYGEVFIQDSFPDYKKAASTTELAKILPSYAGPAFSQEIIALEKLKIEPKTPYVALMGGAKLSDKLDIIQDLIEKVDQILLGGGMAYTFLKSIGVNIGNSLIEEDFIDKAKDLLEKYPEKLLLPIDHAIVSEFNETATNNLKYTEAQEIPKGMIGVDIGPKTIDLFSSHIKTANTILWNGPMGVFEWKKTAKGTIEVAKEISNNHNSYSVTGGGDSLTAINQYNLTGFDHVSTGGGALLYYLSHDDFPTLDNLNFKETSK